MIDEFIKNKLTCKNENRDFVEWHKGRERYAIWAIEVKDEEWIRYLLNARDCLDEYLLQGQHRVAHITLFACGFYEENEKLIEAQISSLKKEGLKSFTLGLSELDSFLSAPYFSISDVSNSLSCMRELLANHKLEDGSGGYTPHMTVGLYDEAYSTVLLAEKIKTYERVTVSDIIVNKISLMTFETNDIFSPLCTEFELNLELN